MGNDPAIGRRLVSLLVEAGAEPVRNTFVFFGGCAGDPPFSLYGLWNPPRGHAHWEGL